MNTGHFKRARGFTLIELLVVMAIIVLFISILLPSLGRARDRAKQTVCASNLRGLTTAAKMYGHDHSGLWPVVPSDVSMTPNVTTPLTGTMGGHASLPRDVQSNLTPSPANRAVSNSRALWMLVRGELVAPEQFICPASNEDIAHGEGDFGRLYDFKGYGYCSYGYQNTLYRRSNSALPRDERDPRMVLIGDKSPFFTFGTIEATESLDLPSDLQAWTQGLADLPNPDANLGFSSAYTIPQNADQRRFNSPNHGGRNVGEGQNIGRADGSVQFVHSPTVGVDGDNIYTAAYSTPNGRVGFVGGYRPGYGSNPGAVPGYRVLSSFSLSHSGQAPTPKVNSGTDTVLMN